MCAIKNIAIEIIRLTKCQLDCAMTADGRFAWSSVMSELYGERSDALFETPYGRSLSQHTSTS